MSSFKMYSTKLISHMQNDNDDVHEAAKAILILLCSTLLTNVYRKLSPDFGEKVLVSDIGSSISKNKNNKPPKRLILVHDDKYCEFNLGKIASNEGNHMQNYLYAVR